VLEEDTERVELMLLEIVHLEETEEERVGQLEAVALAHADWVVPASVKLATAETE
jgi:hypothetical protein